jgi:NDP-sugar pyrophosphorylase family protein
LSIFRADIIAAWPDPDPFDLSAVTRSLAESNRLAGYEVHNRFYEIGKPQGLAETEAYLAAGS